MTDELAEQLSSVGALAEPARRALYMHVAGQPEPVSREAAAAAVGLPAHSAKFHLDRLAEEGLLEVEYRRLSGRTGPGAGRPSKLYRRSERQLSVTLPPRSYDVAGRLLAAAIERAIGDGVPVGDAVHAVAREEGHRIARDEADAPATSDELARTAEVLRRHGYEPRVQDAEVCLANCPFDRLAADHTDLVCGMNLSLIGGMLEGLSIQSLTPRLAPSQALCCVKISR